MSFSVYEEHHDVIWDAVGGPCAVPAVKEARPQPSHEPEERDGPAFICRCWRCRGGDHVPRNERAALDRILARHILRMDQPGEDLFGNFWLREWGMNPRHAGGVPAIRTWMRIEHGANIPEPEYK